MLPSIKEEEERNKKENKKIYKLNIMKAINILQKIINQKQENNLKEKFNKLVSYNEQIELKNNTIQSTISQISGLRYVKKIIPNNLKKFKDNKKFASKKIILHNKSLDVEKQKKILLNKNNLKPFERYENCKDFIDKFRIELIKIIFKERKEKMEN